METISKGSSSPIPPLPQAGGSGGIQRIIERAKRLLLWVWHSDIQFPRKGPQVILLAIISIACILLGLLPQDVISNFSALKSVESVRIFYMVKDLMLSQVESSMVGVLIWASIGRAVFGIFIAAMDVLFYRQVTGRPYDWESMINISLVNTFLAAAALFAVFNPAIRELLGYYDQLIARIPTLVQLNGALALLIAALLGDFAFYWSHRICHSTRLFWNLSHIYHHRNRSLNLLTCSAEPPTMLLAAAGGLSLLILPLVTKLFTTDLHNAGWALVVFIAFDALTDPSHSVALYYVEARSWPLRALRWVFVTVGVHYTHHSRDVEGKYGTGCNFGARMTLWDRLFGTYVEPPREIPPTGLFDPAADTCINPIRYLFSPYLRMGQELRRNHLRHWPKILLGSTDYEPPVPSKLSR